METDDLGASSSTISAELVVEGRPVGGGNRGVLVETELDVVARELLSPGRLARGVRLGWAMAEEVDVEGPAGARADGAELRPELVRRQQRAGQRAEAAGFCHRYRQLGALGSGHRRLDDRQLDPEEVLYPCVRPHDALLRDNSDAGILVLGGTHVKAAPGGIASGRKRAVRSGGSPALR